jgi:hypothetical protein
MDLVFEPEPLHSVDYAKRNAGQTSCFSVHEDVAMGKRWRMVHGYTHSRNARESEERGEMPLSRAIEAVYTSLECKKFKVSRRKVREFLEKHCSRGWHHVAGPNGVREVNYYATVLTDDQKRELLGTVKE